MQTSKSLAVKADELDKHADEQGDEIARLFAKYAR